MHSRTTVRIVFFAVLVLVAACGDDPPSGAPAIAPESSPQWQTDAGATAARPAKLGLVHREDGAWDGYTLIAPLNGRTVYLVDMDGRPVHTWETQHMPAGGAYLLPNGNLLRCVRVEAENGAQRGGIGGLTQELDWDGKVVWECDLSPQGLTQHHDLHPLANGNVLLIVRQFHAGEEALARGRDPRHRSDAALWSDLVVEVEPTRPSGGRVVWSWDAWDHQVQDHDAKAAGFGVLAEHVGRIDINADHRSQPATETPEKRARRERLEAQMRAVGYAGEGAPRDEERTDATPVASRTEGAHDSASAGEDWLHLNGIDYSPEHDLIALSSRHLSEVFVIDHSTTTAQAATDRGGRFGHGGDLLYRWGNPRSYGMGELKDQRLFLQHDVTWTSGAEPGTLHFLAFNNGPRLEGHEISSVDEIAAPFDPIRGFTREANRPFGPAGPLWNYADPGHFYSGFIAGAQRLPNGNTLICEGAKGRVFEVRPDKHVVWDYWNPYSVAGPAGVAPQAALFHATRVAKDHPGLRGRL